MPEISKSVKFVQGAVDAGLFLPVLKNFAIKDNAIQGTNDVVTLNAAIDLPGVDVCVDAQRFLRAIAASDAQKTQPTITQTSTGGLAIKAGRFRAAIPSHADTTEFPWSTPDGDAYLLSNPEKFIRALRIVRPFIGKDATRPWSMGVLLREGILYATNNIILVAIDTDETELPSLTLPISAVDELVRVHTSLNIVPKRLTAAEQSVTWFYAKHWWLKTRLIATDWPDVAKMLESARKTKLKPVPPTLRDAYSLIKASVLDTTPVFIKNNVLRTSVMSDTDYSAVEDVGAADACTTAATLELVLSVATHIGFDKYPDNIPFARKTADTHLVGMMAAYRSANGPKPTHVAPKK